MKWILQEEKQKAKSEADRVEKWEYYLAQIACEIVKPRITNPNSISYKNFMFSFEYSEPDSKDTAKSKIKEALSHEEQVKKASDLSKARWFGVLNAATGLSRKEIENGNSSGTRTSSGQTDGGQHSSAEHPEED